MAYEKPKKRPQFADLIAILAQSKGADPALYQTVQEIIHRLDQLALPSEVGGAVQLVPVNAGGTTPIPPPTGTGMNLDYLGNYVPGTYNDGDIVIGSDGVAYVCVVDGTTTPPEPWTGSGVKPHHVTHEYGGTDEVVSINAYNLTIGLVNQARLGSGAVGLGQKYLADDQTWKTLSASTVDNSPIGSGYLWFTNTPPTNYLLCWGSAVSRTTYAALFALIGTTYGAGDGFSTFNVPNLIGRFPLGITSSGATNALGVMGGNLDHVHSIAADGLHAHLVPPHQHSTDVHAHGAGGLVAASHNHGGVVGGSTGAAGEHNHAYAATTGTAHGGAAGADGGGSFTASTFSHMHDVSGNTNPGGNHSHSFEAGIPAQSPAVSGVTANSGGGLTSSAGGVTTYGDGSHSHAGFTGPNNPPFITVNFIIKAL